MPAPCHTPGIRARHGITLIETVVVVAVAAILLIVGVPGLARMAADLRLTTTVNALVTHVQLARSEAARRNAAVVLCKAADTALPACAGATDDWSAGWLVFAAHHPNAPTRLTDPQQVLAHHRPARQLSVNANRQAFVFHFGLRSTNGTLVVCDHRNGVEPRAVIVSHTGRPRVSRQAAGGGPLAC